MKNKKVLFICHNCRGYNTKQIVWCPWCGHRLIMARVDENAAIGLRYHHFAEGRPTRRQTLNLPILQPVEHLRQPHDLPYNLQLPELQLEKKELQPRQQFVTIREKDPGDDWV